MQRRPPPTGDTSDVACRHCRKAFRQVGWAHLVYRHHYAREDAVAEYKRRFGLALVTCDETRDGVAKARVADWDRRGRRWSPESIAEELRRRDRRGETLSARWMCVNKGVIYVRAIEFYGSWHGALAAAGIVPRKIRGRAWWTPEHVREAILRRHAAGRRLVHWKGGQQLKAAARKFHGTWQAAIEACGITYERLPTGPRASWTPERVIAGIQKRARLAKPLNTKALLKECCMLYIKGREFFRTWKAALAAAGVRPEEVMERGRWTRETVVTAIRERARRGLPLNRMHAGAVLASAHRLFGSWPEALRAAGIDPDSVRRIRTWTNDAIVARIREWAGHGLELHRCAATRRDSGFVSAALKRFGSWDAALIAAGLDPSAIRRGLPDGSPVPPHSPPQPAGEAAGEREERA